MRELILKTVAMPKDTNYRGYIFGGWSLSQMDLAAGYFGSKLAKHPVVTKALNKVNFMSPINVGDIVEIEVELIKLGNTSMHLLVEMYSVHRLLGTKKMVISSEFVVVAVNEENQPIKINNSP